MDITLLTQQEMLATLCKLLLDEDRLQLLGRLAQQPCSADVLQAELNVARPQLHLQKLQAAGLIQHRQTAAGEYYQLNHEQIIEFKRRLFARAEATPAQSADEKELAKFIKQGRLVQLPAHPHKLRLVLGWLAEQFEVGVAYPERQVNERLKGHAEDHATLRRLLVDYGLLVRASGIYQRSVHNG
jgi:hypothetical protein